ncbi:MAG: hypothetical protein M3527_01395, partial [Actinomycetota bacterium]|nr:hypothetical protein [Actinomycetota bacterium]
YAAAAHAVLRRAGAGVEAAAPAGLIGAMLFALDHDLNRQEVIDPGHVPATSFADAVELLVASAVALAKVSRRYR